MDPAVVNLSDFETFYPEKRPFFVQGRQIFDNFGGNGPNNRYRFDRSEPDLFYTRRIGRPPQGSADGDYVMSPQFTTILGAAKLAGKTADGWSLGILDAVTGSESARWSAGQESGRLQVEPLTNYFVARVFRDANRAGYGGVFTAVNRDNSRSRPAAAAGAVRLRGGAGRVRLPRSAERLGRRGPGGRELARRQPRVRREGPARLPALLPAPGPTGAATRPHPHLPRRLDRERQPQPPVGERAGQRRDVGHEPRLRVERPGLQPAQRSLGRPPGGAVPPVPSGPLHPLPLAPGGQGLLAQLRPGEAGRQPESSMLAPASTTTGTWG